MFIIFIIKSKWVRNMAAKTEKKNFTEFLRKYKLFIFAGLVLVGLIIMIMLIYVLTYANNKPKAFKSDSKVKITNKSDYFTLTLYASKIDWNKSMTIEASLSNFNRANLKDVSITYELHSNWTSKGDYTSDSAHKFNSGNVIYKTTSSETSYEASATLTFPNAYPIKVLPFVKVKHPTLFAKVSYKRKLPATQSGDPGYSSEEYVYYSFSFSDYVDTTKTVFN